MTLGRQFVQRGGIGGRLAGFLVFRHRQLQLVDQHFLQLLGRADAEFPARQFEDAGLAGLRLFHRIRFHRVRVFNGLQQFVEIAVFAHQRRRGRFADALDTGDVVRGIAQQRLYVDDVFRPDAEFLHHLVRADELVLHRIHHAHTGPDQLHQVLVGRDDGDVIALFDGEPRIGRDQIVGLEALHLQTGQRIGARRFPDQIELRDQFFGRGRPVGLVFRVNIAAERLARRIEYDGQEIGLGILHQLGQHVGEAVHRVDRRPVRPRHRRQGMKGAENIGRAVDQIDVIRFVVACRFLGHAAVFPLMIYVPTACRIAGRESRIPEPLNRQTGKNPAAEDNQGLRTIFPRRSRPSSASCA